MKILIRTCSIPSTDRCDRTTTAATFYDFGNFDLGGVDLPDGTLDDFLLIYRTYAGTTTPTPARPYDIIVKVRDADNDYWDWGTETNVMMSTNQEVEIDILRAKPVIQNLVDVTVDEDTGLTSISMTDLAQDYQDQAATLHGKLLILQQTRIRTLHRTHMH